MDYKEYSLGCISNCVDTVYKNTFTALLVTSQALSKPATLKTVWINQTAMWHANRRQCCLFKSTPSNNKPKQKHTVKLAAFMFKSNRSAISLWWGSLKGSPSCQALSGLQDESSQTNTTHIEWLYLEELSSHTACWSPMRAKASPQGYIIILLKVLLTDGKEYSMSFHWN